MGHPASYNWYEEVPEMGPRPIEPNTRSRLEVERRRVKELVPYAVVFPYRKMGQQLSGFSVDTSGGQFGPFQNQIFIGDFSLGVLMRATTEKVNGVWQGACYPFREGFATGLLANQFTPGGQLVVGGTNRGWPVRGPKPFALQRVDWTGDVPFELREVSVRKDGFQLSFTQPIDPVASVLTANYVIETYTHIYRSGYGSPEVDHTQPKVSLAIVNEGGRGVRLKVDGMVQGHVHDFDLSRMKSQEGDSLIHSRAYYTLNEIPRD